jgi:inorganic pyrophosphatase
MQSGSIVNKIAGSTRSTRSFGLVATSLMVSFLISCASSSGGVPIDSGLKAKGEHTFTSKRNLLTNNMARNQDGSINVVIEIPTGTSEKWEVSEDGNAIVRDFTGESPRTIDYLPYPGNYGLIPRTLLDESQGGDGGALDCLVLGTAVPRGSIVRARPIAVLRVVDRMAQDDKIIAVMEGPTLKDVYDVETLDSRYPGAKEIIGLWFSNAYGTRSKVEMVGTGSRGQANSVIEFAIESYKQARRRDRAESAN